MQKPVVSRISGPVGMKFEQESSIANESIKDSDLDMSSKKLFIRSKNISISQENGQNLRL